MEREDCDAGTVQQLRNGLAQGKTQYRTLREVTEALKKKAEAATGAAAKRWHLKLGIANFFLGYLAAGRRAPQAGRRGAGQLLPRQGAPRTARLRRSPQGLREGREVGLHRQPGAIAAGRHPPPQGRIHAGPHPPQQARRPGQPQRRVSTSRLASLLLAEGQRLNAIRHLERAVELDPGHTGALFQLGHANDLAGNDDEAIVFYERCLNHPPVHVGMLMNLGILYEDRDQYEKAVECYQNILHGQPDNEQARLFLKDAQASLTMYYNPDEDMANSRFSQVLEIPVTDFELSVRSRNCLKKMNIRTLGDLTRVSEQQLLSSKNFGETSLIEIKEMLGSKGLRLGQSLEEGATFERRFPTSSR